MCNAWLLRCTDPCILQSKSLTAGIYCAGNHELCAVNSSSTYAYVVSRLKGCTSSPILTGTNYSPGSQILVKGFSKLWPKTTWGSGQRDGEGPFWEDGWIIVALKSLQPWDHRMSTPGFEKKNKIMQLYC